MLKYNIQWVKFEAVGIDMKYNGKFFFSDLFFQNLVRASNASTQYDMFSLLEEFGGHTFGEILGYRLINF